MTSEEKKRERTVRARQYLDELTARYPDCFTNDPARIRPLAIGIQRHIRADEAARLSSPEAEPSQLPALSVEDADTADAVAPPGDSAEPVETDSTEAAERVPGWLLRHALSIYTRSTPYLQAVVEGRRRCRLDGSDAEEVNEAAITFATNMLAERQQRRAAKREAQIRKSRRAKAAQQQAAAGETGKTGDAAPTQPRRQRPRRGKDGDGKTARQADRRKPPRQPAASTTNTAGNAGTSPPRQRDAPTADAVRLTPEQRRAAKLKALMEKFNQR